MPQLEEIITKYDPAIIWWDTGSMLPYEMTRAMFDRANQLKPSIVMNDRNGAYYSGNDKVLDYHGTPDKPRYFQPVDGYWEAIPTTNESYGYSKLDKSHQKPSELIELLARAASKGGNVQDPSIHALNVQGNPAAESVLRFIGVKDALLTASRVLTPSAAFLQLEGAANPNVIVDGGDLTKAASPVALKTGATAAAVKLRGG